jgi:hypothetical protein
VLNHLPGDPKQIRYFPCENIEIVPEKSEEHEFLFGVEIQADLEILVRIVGIDQNLLVFSYRSSLQLVVCPLIGGQLIGRRGNISAFLCYRRSRGITVGGLDADGLLRVPQPLVLATLAACS